MAHDIKTPATFSPFSSHNAIEAHKNPFENNLKHDNFPSFEDSLQYGSNSDSKAFETPRQRSSHTSMTEPTEAQLTWSIDTLSAMNPVDFSPPTEQKAAHAEPYSSTESIHHEDSIARKLFPEEPSAQLSTTLSPTFWHFEKRYAPNPLHVRCQEAIMTYQTHVKDRHLKMTRFQLSAREKKFTAKNDLFGCPLSPILNSQQHEKEANNSKTLPNKSIKSPKIYKDTNRSKSIEIQNSTEKAMGKTDYHVTSLHSVSLLEDASQITLQNEENKSFECASSTCSFTPIKDQDMRHTDRFPSHCFSSNTASSIAKDVAKAPPSGSK
uniref:AlNc14C312G10499 protein n=1 Tax=Albugo laibachii Nc14 TaxID=890382 RepID=F0WW54_9STRA|nr:AlNc14C312G10499 [Albugo laibachii Nc14]|eukprot:CCA25673.1 AlNc14C312G10499 [Albugo laibachii Nc14]